MLEVFMVGIPALFMVLYAIIGGVALALPLAGVLHPSKHERLTTPITYPLFWELTHLLLAGGFVAWAGIFPLAAQAAGPLLEKLWIALMTAFIVRGVLLMFAGFTGQRQPALRWSIVVSSLAIPVILVHSAVVLMTGDTNPLNHLGVAIALDSLALALPIALWGGFFYRPGQITREIASFCFWLALMLALFTWPLALVLDPVVLDGRGLIFLHWPVVLAACLAIGSLATEWRRRYFVASAILVAGVAWSMLLVQWPFLVRPSLQIHSAITDVSGQAGVTLMFATILALLVPSSLAAYRSFKRR